VAGARERTYAIPRRGDELRRDTHGGDLVSTIGATARCPVEIPTAATAAALPTMNSRFLALTTASRIAASAA
jgi:hypothetical protein